VPTLETIAELAPRLRREEMSPVELTHACLDRIEKLNPVLNAFITVTAESALAEARAAEVEMSLGQWRGPLHGIPIAIKDLIDTAGTLVKTATALMENGATAVYACASHPVLSGPAVENISQSHITEVVVTNTIPLSEAARKESKIRVLSIAGLIGRAIQSIHEETSVSKLFL